MSTSSGESVGIVVEREHGLKGHGHCSKQEADPLGGVCPRPLRERVRPVRGNGLCEALFVKPLDIGNHVLRSNGHQPDAIGVTSLQRCQGAPTQLVTPCCFGGLSSPRRAAMLAQRQGACRHGRTERARLGQPIPHQQQHGRRPHQIGPQLAQEAHLLLERTRVLALEADVAVRAGLVQLGVRVENTNSDGELNALVSTNNQRVKRNYTNWFPSGGITYNMTQKHSLALIYSRRIERPDYQSLNPFEYQIDEVKKYLFLMNRIFDEFANLQMYIYNLCVRPTKKMQLVLD